MPRTHFNLLQQRTPYLIRCALFTALITVGAFIRIPMPYFDYFTLQFLFVILSGMLLGPKWGTLSVVIYVIMGLMGLPIFAAGGGLTYVLRPTFGFLLAFIPTSFAVGLIATKWSSPSFKKYLTAALVGLVITYALGLTYKYFILNFYLNEGIPWGLIILAPLPVEVPADIIFCVFAAVLGKQLHKLGLPGENHVPRY